MATSKLSWSQVTHLHPAKACLLLQRHERQALMLMLRRSLALVPPNRLESIFRGYALPQEIGATRKPKKPPLVDAAREFCRAALRGDYYDPFDVNAKNFSSKSRGTQHFGVELQMLWDRCETEADAGNPTEICETYDLLLNLLSKIDECDEEILFWGDEGGTWQLAINWQWVLPPYFRCLRQSVPASEFEQRARAVLKEFESMDRGCLAALVTELC